MSIINCSVENHQSVDGQLLDRSLCTDCGRLEKRLDMMSKTNSIKQALLLSQLGVHFLLDTSGYFDESLAISRSFLQLLTNSMITEAFPAATIMKTGLMRFLLFLDIILVIAGSQIADLFDSTDFILILIISGLLNLLIHYLLSGSISFERNRIKWIHSNKNS